MSKHAELNRRASLHGATLPRHYRSRFSKPSAGHARDFGDVLVGLIYLKYEQGKISMANMLDELADAVDAYESSQFRVEEVAKVRDSQAKDERSLSLQLQRLAVRSAQLCDYLGSQDLYEKESASIDS